mmetsp:Transcript_4355/g.4507  ORF Transcript_4355/g.4507 Transcript_4355/m.4507 type:complete len:183 (+) Transcript_4355:96-644(+)
MSSLLKIALIFAIVSCTFAFSPSKRFNQAAISKTQVFENFDAFEREEIKKKAAKVGSNPAIFTELQLTEFRDELGSVPRGNLLQEIGLGFISDFFNGGGDSQEGEAKAPKAAAAPGFAKALRPTVSISVLEEKTVLYVNGKTDAKTYNGVLKAAFGDKLSEVLPQILANLPSKKASELQKMQ